MCSTADLKKGVSGTEDCRWKIKGILSLPFISMLRKLLWLSVYQKHESKEGCSSTVLWILAKRLNHTQKSPRIK